MTVPNIVGIIKVIKLEMDMPTSGKKLAKLFKKKGYQIVSGGKGSHMKLKKNGKPTVIIPDHKELKKGLESNLKKILEEV